MKTKTKAKMKTKTKMKNKNKNEHKSKNENEYKNKKENENKMNVKSFCVVVKSTWPRGAIDDQLSTDQQEYNQPSADGTC